MSKIEFPQFNFDTDMYVNLSAVTAIFSPTFNKKEYNF